MAIQVSFTDPETGATYAQAHIVIDDPVMVADGKRVALKATIWANAAAKAAGKVPVKRLERVFDDDSDYDGLRASNLNTIEPALIARFFSGGTRVPD